MLPDHCGLARFRGRGSGRQLLLALDSDARTREFVAHAHEILVPIRRLLLQRLSTMDTTSASIPGTTLDSGSAAPLRILLSRPSFIVPGERLPADDQLVGHEPDGEDVAAMIDREPTTCSGDM